ncbi:MAG TPA: apolipoprotein N-acyltransferase, partial [Egibacteraceae bacterium]|nr:apolipoprotein N-acyltransferase [Egibacteraceae bacterium]
MLALVPLLLLARAVQADRRPLLAGFGWGLLAGLAFFGPLLTWIARFGVVPWILLSLILAVFVGVFVAGVAAWGTRPWRSAAAVVLWVALEAVRSSFPLGGFPWGVLGYTQHDGGPLLGVARTLGVLGVSAAAAAIAAGVESLLVHLVGSGAPKRVRAAAPAAAGVALMLGGSFALSASPPPSSGGSIDIAAVQGYDEELPPLSQARDDQTRIEQVTRRMVEASRELGDGAQRPELTVWPENALDADVRTNQTMRRFVDEALELVDSPLLAGGQLFDAETDTLRTAMILFEEPSAPGEAYVKRRLIPFGEYVPLRRWVDWYPALRHLPRDATPGDIPGVFDVGGAVVGPIACFESIFPEIVHDQVRAGAQVLVVSTNTSSYGRTAASRQHLAFSQLRAVETGRWIMHTGISGISGVVDPEGRVTHQTELYERAI